MSSASPHPRAIPRRVRLDSIAEIQAGYAPRSPVVQAADSPWRIVLGRHAGAVGCIDWTELPPCDPGRSGARFAIQDGDVLLTIRTTVLRALVVRDAPPKVVASAQFARLRPRRDRVEPDYLAWCLNRPGTRERLGGLARGSSIPFLPPADLAGFEITLPPLERQRALARVLELKRREGDLRARLDRALDHWIDAASRENTPRG